MYAMKAALVQRWFVEVIERDLGVDLRARSVRRGMDGS